MVFKFTHTIRMDWMLPGAAPTGKRVEVPLVAIVRFRKGKLAHEHIYWDQASVLVQLGLLDAARLPVAGIESARKALDPTLPANQLIKRSNPPEHPATPQVARRRKTGVQPPHAANASQPLPSAPIRSPAAA